MAFRDTWHRALVYFGLAEDPGYRDGGMYEPETGQDLYESPAPRGATVSPLRERRRGRDEIDDIFAEDEPVGRGGRMLRPVGGNGADVRVHLVTPYSFNDAQEVADKTFLLTPRNVEVSAEEKARLVEKGFFNQS